MKTLRDTKGRFVSNKVVKVKKNEIQDQLAKVDQRLIEIEQKIQISIPKIVREVIKGLLLPIIKVFNPEDLEIIKPTPKDPIVKYQGETILWYLDLN